MPKTVIVVDTSVMISALIGKRGASRQVVRECLTGDYLPLMSNALFLEYEDVSARNKIKKYCPLSEQEITDLLAAFYKVCIWVPIYFLWRPTLMDESDNFLIELAVAGNAECIVTNNIKDLKSAELSFLNLRVRKPEQLLRGD